MRSVRKERNDYDSPPLFTSKGLPSQPRGSARSINEQLPRKYGSTASPCRVVRCRPTRAESKVRSERSRSRAMRMRYW
jgi:hypothetical protein